MYRIYKLLTIMLLPFLPIYIKYRIYRKKEDATRYKERFAIASCPRPQNTKLIWIHVASLGELNSMLPLVNYMHFHSQTSFLITTMTLTASRRAQELNLERVIHQFLPFDSPIYCKRFLKHWCPDLAIFVESELWPNFIQYAGLKMPLVLLNARISDKTFARWQKFPSMIRSILDKFHIIYASARTDLQNLRAFTPNTTLRWEGNLKYMAGSTQLPDTKKLKDQLKPRKTWLYASSHEGEEQLAIQTHIQLRKQFPGLLTVIAPRHITRIPDIINLISGYGLKFTKYSEGPSINEDIDILLINRLSQLDILYSLIDITVIGGSFVPVGGHNILEAARLNCAIIIGPYTYNCASIIDEFKKKDAIIQLQSSDNLAQHIARLLITEDEIGNMQANALQVVKENTSSPKKLSEEILTLLENQDARMA